MSSIQPTTQSPKGTAASRDNSVALAAIGGLLGALAASSCCLLPLGLFSLGVSGAWISNLTALGPYQPIFLAFTAAVLAFGFHRVYARRAACADETACARPLTRRTMKVGLWLAAALTTLAVVFPHLATSFLPT